MTIDENKIDYADPSSITKHIQELEQGIKNAQQQVRVLRAARKALYAAYAGSEGMIVKNMRVALDNIFNKYMRIMTLDEIIEQMPAAYGQRDREAFRMRLARGSAELGIVMYEEKGYLNCYGPKDFFNSYGGVLRDFYPDKEIRDTHKKNGGKR